jgi:hypothetical protein
LLSAAWSQERANFQSRITVSGETEWTSAVSSTLGPTEETQFDDAEFSS